MRQADDCEAFNLSPLNQLSGQQQCLNRFAYANIVSD
jgi:hypothetical protein